MSANVQKTLWVELGSPGHILQQTEDGCSLSSNWWITLGDAGHARANCPSPPAAEQPFSQIPLTVQGFFWQSSHAIHVTIRQKVAGACSFFGRGSEDTALHGCICGGTFKVWVEPWSSPTWRGLFPLPTPAPGQGGFYWTAWKDFCRNSSANSKPEGLFCKQRLHRLLEGLCICNRHQVLFFF